VTSPAVSWFGSTVALAGSITRILTDVERKRIQKYLKADGEKNLHVRQLVYQSRRHLARIRADLDLIEKLLSAYELNKTK
jgi:isochorismate synthase EntC